MAGSLGRPGKPLRRHPWEPGASFVVSIADGDVPGVTAGLGAASGSRRNRQDQLPLITNPLQSSP